MKKSIVNKILSLSMVVVLSVACLVGCGEKKNETLASKDETIEKQEESVPIIVEGKGGTIMWLSNLSSGIQYDTDRKSTRLNSSHL